jgi:hypothetical protein
MLNIEVEREKTYLKNAQRLYGVLQGDEYYKPGGAFQTAAKRSNMNLDLENWYYDRVVGTMVRKKIMRTQASPTRVDKKSAIGGGSNFAHYELESVKKRHEIHFAHEESVTRAA